MALLSVVFGGFLGGSIFSILGALVGGIAIFGVLFLGWLIFVDRKEQKGKELTPEMRGVFDRR